uniref:Cytochrome P450 n=1 Tax=Oryza punctata TaxID=4537 RepID=A0A0E0LDV3_ORYPU
MCRISYIYMLIQRNHYGYFYLGLALVSLLVVLFARRRRSAAAAAHGEGGLRLPPGPWQLPVIGSLQHLAGKLPHRAMRDLARRHGPVMMLRLGEVPTLVVSSRDAAREVMRTHDAVFATRPLSASVRAATKGGRDIAFAPYGDYWRQLRKIAVTELLSARRVASFRAIREEEVGAMLRTVAAAASGDGRTVELRAALCALVADSTVRAVVGERCAGRDVFLRELDRAIELATGLNVADLWPSSRLAGRLSGAVRQAERCRDTMFGVLDGIIQAHLEKTGNGGGGGGEDLLDVLLRIHKEGGLHLPLDMDAVKYVVVDVISGGCETSATTLGWAIAELIRNPNAMQKATAEVRRAFEATGAVPTLVVSSRDAAREVMKTHDAAFASRPLSATVRVLTSGGRGIIFAPYGGYWRQLRKIAVTELLTARRVASFRAIREEEVGTMLRAVAEAAAAGRRAVEMRAALSALVADITVRAVMGDRCKDRDVFLRKLQRTIELSAGFNPADLWPSSRLAGRLGGAVRQAEECHDTVFGMLDGIIQEHMERRTSSSCGDGDGQDLLDVLLRVQKEGGLEFPLDMVTIKQVIFLHANMYHYHHTQDIFGAGSETSATTLEWVMAELIRNPKVKQKATAEVRRAFAADGAVSEHALGELHYLHLVIRETFRLHTPLPLLLPRECREPCRVLGYDVPRGTQVLVNVWAIGRDERYWPGGSPEEFRPERFDDGEAAAAVDFKGADFELLPADVPRDGFALASLLFHFDWEEPSLTDPAGFDMAEAFGITVRRKAHLVLRPILRLAVPGVSQLLSHVSHHILRDAEMADGYFYLALALVSLLAVLFASHRRSAAAHGDAGLRLPPGPWQLPVIGSLHHLAGKLPHRAMRDLARQHGPVMMLRLGEVPTLVVSSRDAAREVMRTHDAVFATRPLSASVRAATKGGRDIAFAPYGDYWRQLRKIAVTELLSARRVASFRAIREEEVGAMLRTVAAAASGDGRTVELRAALCALVADSTVRAVVGERCAGRDVFLRELDRAIELATGLNVADLWPSSRLAGRLSGAVRQAERCRDTMFGVLDGIIQAHLEKTGNGGGGGGEDLLDVLLRIHKEGGLHLPLDMDAVKYVVVDVISGGCETSATTLGWAIAELIRNPNAMQKATAEVRRAFEATGAVSESALGELPYLRLVVRETLRLHPPLPLLLPRECQEPCRVLGYDVPRGTQVLVNAWALGRDERYWPGGSPEEFRPERFGDSEAAAAVDFKGADFELLPFGAGRRICPGMVFGLANVELPLASLLFHFDWEVPGMVLPTEFDMTEAFGITARRKANLLLRPILRVPRFDDGEAAAAVDFKGADFELLPFGAGRRMCPGMAFGLANVELALASLIFHFDWEAPGVPDPAEFDMTEGFGITARRKANLLLRPTLRVPIVMIEVYL